MKQEAKTITKSVSVTLAVTAGMLSLLVRGNAAPHSNFHPCLQTAKPKTSAPPNVAALKFNDLKQDSRLSHPVTCDFELTRLDDALETFARQEVEPELAAHKLHCCCASKSLYALMVALARVFDVSWRKSGEGYQLFRTSEQWQAENRAKRRSEQNEQAFLSKQGELLYSQIMGALLQNPLHREAFADFLAGYDRDMISRAIPSALEDEPILSATDQSHFHNHLFAARPFTSLTPTQQSAVTQIAGAGRYAHLSANSSVGIIAAAGGFRLGIIEPDGRDVWVAPTHPSARWVRSASGRGRTIMTQM